MIFKKVLQAVFPRINYYYQFFSVFHSPAKKVVSESYVVDFSAEESAFVELCAQSFNYDVDYTKGYRQKEIYTVNLQDVLFLGNSGALVQKNKVVVESVFDQLRLTKSPAFRSPAKMQLEQKAGIYTSLMHLPWAEKSNYHWFLDCLPRIYALLQEVNAPVTIIIPKNIPDFQLETLEFILKKNPNFKLASISKNEKWEISEFIFPSFVSNHYSGYLPRPIADLIRNNIWGGYQVKKSVPEKIYISRSKTTKRRLLNEAEIIAELQPQGFKIVYAEELTYQEQVKLFYNAEVIVGVHGAGLTNILFSQQVKVLELHPEEMVRSHYFMICKALNFEYQYVIGDRADEDQDFKVEPEDFKKALRCLLN